MNNEQNTAEENVVSSEYVSSKDDTIPIEPVISRTRYEHTIKKLISIYLHMGEYSVINVNTPIEKQLVRGRIGGNFENTAKLKVLKFN